LELKLNESIESSDGSHSQSGEGEETALLAFPSNSTTSCLLNFYRSIQVQWTKNAIVINFINKYSHQFWTLILLAKKPKTRRLSLFTVY